MPLHTNKWLNAHARLVIWEIGETPDFQEALEKDKPVGVPIGALFRHHMLPTLAGTFAVVAGFALDRFLQRRQAGIDDLVGADAGGAGDQRRYFQ